MCAGLLQLTPARSRRQADGPPVWTLCVPSVVTNPLPGTLSCETGSASTRWAFTGTALFPCQPEGPLLPGTCQARPVLCRERFTSGPAQVRQWWDYELWQYCSKPVPVPSSEGAPTPQEPAVSFPCSIFLLLCCHISH